MSTVGKSGDGGIDGIGIIRFADLMQAFPVDRSNASVGTALWPLAWSGTFAGAMAGRADRGIVITTSDIYT